MEPVNITHSGQRDKQRDAEEGRSQQAALQHNDQYQDETFKALNIQEDNPYPDENVTLKSNPKELKSGKRKRCIAFLIVLIVVLVTLCVVIPSLWFLAIPLMIFLIIKLYNKLMSKGSDTTDPKVLPDGPLHPPQIPPKLQNLGSTCFFNAALQGIFSTSEFYTLYVMTSQAETVDGRIWRKNTYTKDYVVYSNTSRDAPLQISVVSTSGPLTEALNLLFWKIQTHSSLSPRNLRTQLGKTNSRFNTRGRQEDSHEALRCIFSALKDEEIQAIKKEIENYYSKNYLDGEEKLELKGYLQMAEKVPTAIDQVIEGKQISVMICHECHDVIEIVEPFFDISVAIPEEKLLRYKHRAPDNALKCSSSLKTTTGVNTNFDENKNLIEIECVDKKETDDDEMESKRDDSAYVVKGEDKIGQPNDTSQVNATCASSYEAIPTGTNHLNSTSQDTSVPHIIVTANDPSVNLEGSDTGMKDIPSIQAPRNTTTRHNSDNSDPEIKIRPVNHLPARGQVESTVLAAHIDKQNLHEKVIKNSQEIESTSAQWAESQETKLKNQEAQYQDRVKENYEQHKYLITHNKDYFQECLIEKRLNYQFKPEMKQVETSDVQFSLSMYTDLDVLDEDNKFICEACTVQNQLANLNEHALCQVSKQIMIHHLPPVLILHMKRFDIGLEKVTKDDRHVSFPEILDMAPYCTTECVKELGDSRNKILYGLYAVVVHKGRTLHGGHYIAFVKSRPAKEIIQDEGEQGNYDESYCEKGRWYFTSDTNVRECSLEEVKESKAFMLFYEKLPFIPIPATTI